MNPLPERITHSNRVFSPYHLPQVIYAPTGFKVEDRLKEIEVVRLEREGHGINEFEESEGNIRVREGSINSLEAIDAHAFDLSSQRSTTVLMEDGAINTHKAATTAVKPAAPDLDTFESPKANIKADAVGTVGSPRKRSTQDYVNAGPPLGPKLAKSTHPVQEKQRHAKAEKRDRQKQTRLSSLSTHLVNINFPPENVQVVQTGYTGTRQGHKGKATYTLEEAERAGLKDAGWNGSKACLLATADGTCIGICYPSNTNDAQLEEQKKAGAHALGHVTNTVHLSPKEASNHRGTSPVLARGISYGGGQDKPAMHSHSNMAHKAVEHLASMPVFDRYSGTTNHKSLLQLPTFTYRALFSDCLKFYAPKAYDLQEKKLKEIIGRHPHLKPNFNNTVFAACMWNPGPQFVSYPYVNSNNYPYTWCAITTMGDFNPDLGGHLILWDLGLYVRFPPGATILIPSALPVHSNISVCPGEKWYSFVQYTTGALLRWVNNRFQRQDQWEASALVEMKEARKLKNQEWVKMGLSMFSTVEQLQKTYTSI
ncbi:hypothetical protein PQX77_021246 [Marasmius sp. AFHP31]|nr:hypothetical protein PQX77_021246 [Marasmius sp. AFHP31]